MDPLPASRCGVRAGRWALAVAGRRGRGRAGGRGWAKLRKAKQRQGTGTDGRLKNGTGWRQSLEVGAVKLVQGAMRQAKLPCCSMSSLAAMRPRGAGQAVSGHNKAPDVSGASVADPAASRGRAGY